MNNRYRRAVMWALYSLLFLLVLLIQTVVLGDQRFYGAKLSLLPVAIVCSMVAMQITVVASFIRFLICACPS